MSAYNSRDPLLPPEGALEEAAGHPLVQPLSAIVAATVAGPVGAAVASVFSTIASTTASEQFKSRVVTAFDRLQGTLATMQEQIARMSTAQYKFASENLNTMLRTAEEEKLRYLSDATVGGIADANLTEADATILARTLRDISVPEIQFLMSLGQADRIVLHGAPVFEPHAGDSPPTAGQVSREIQYTLHTKGTITGLISLGLLADAKTWEDAYVLMPTAKRLISMLANSSSTAPAK